MNEDVLALQGDDTAARITHREDVSKCLALVVQSHIWRLQHRECDLPRLLATIGELEVPRQELVACECINCGFDSLNLYHDFRRNIDHLQKLARDAFAGACLDCFKAGGKFRGRCRFEHAKKDEDLSFEERSAMDRTGINEASMTTDL